MLPPYRECGVACMPMIDRRAMILAAAAAAFPFGVLRAQERAAIVEGARREGKLAFAHTVSAPNFPRFMQAFSAKYPFIEVASGLYSAPTDACGACRGRNQANSLTFDVLHVASVAPFLTLSKRARCWAIARRNSRLTRPRRQAATNGDGARDRGDHGLQPQCAGARQGAQSLGRHPQARVQGPQADHPGFGRGDGLQPDVSAGEAARHQFIRKFGGNSRSSLHDRAADRPARTRQALVGATVDHLRAFEPDPVKAGITAVYPSEGMPLAIAPIAIFKAAPHPNAAKLFVDYVLSEEGQTLLAVDILGAYSMRRGVRTATGQTPLAETKPLLPKDLDDYERASRDFPETFDSYFKS